MNILINKAFSIKKH